jgi:hypothetical protein
MINARRVVALKSEQVLFSEACCDKITPNIQKIYPPLGGAESGD